MTEPKTYWCCGTCDKPFVNEEGLRRHQEHVQCDGDRHDGEPWGSIKPTLVAEWTDDCSGKKNFDGRIVVLSSRYWPASRHESGKHHCHAAICLVKGRDGDFIDVVHEHFWCDTFAELSAAVKAWAEAMVARVWTAVIATFAADEPTLSYEEP